MSLISTLQPPAFAERIQWDPTPIWLAGLAPRLWVLRVLGSPVGRTVSGSG